MAFITVGPGMVYPPYFHTGTSGTGTQKTMDADDEKHALIGHIFWEGMAASKTVSTGGSVGKIVFRTGTGVSFNDSPATTINVGIQDVASGAGPHVRPDDSFDVNGTLTSGTDTVGSSSWITVPMTTGTKTISHGDLIAIVWHMTNRETDDVVTLETNTISSPFLARPATNSFLAGAWQAASQGELPEAYIVADDGTLGVIYGGLVRITFAVPVTESFADGTNPDERGVRFTAPFDCKVIGLAVGGCDNASDGDFTVTLWSAPTTAASSMVAVSVLGEQMSATVGQYWTLVLPTEQTLTAGTEYGVTIRATSTGSVVLRYQTLNTEDLWSILADTSCGKITRDGGSGNFTAESPAVSVPFMGVIISQIDDGTGTGSSGGVTPLGNQLHPIGTGVGA